MQAGSSPPQPHAKLQDLQLKRCVGGGEKPQNNYEGKK